MPKHDAFLRELTSAMGEVNPPLVAHMRYDAVYPLTMDGRRVEGALFLGQFRYGDRDFSEFGDVSVVVNLEAGIAFVVMEAVLPTDLFDILAQFVKAVNRALQKAAKEV